MKPHVPLVGPHLQVFFSEHLCNHKRASPQTIASCRDTFRLLLQFLKKATGIEPAAMKIADIDAPRRGVIHVAPQNLQALVESLK